VGTFGAEIRILIASFLSNRVLLRLASSVFVASLSGCALFGCAREDNGRIFGAPGFKQVRVPLPQQALLKPQRKPMCTLETSSALPHGPDHVQPPRGEQTRVASLVMDGNVDRSISSRSASASRPVAIPVQTDLSLAQRVKLEYERDCFSRAEARVRHRLLRLQVATGAMVKAVKRAEQVGP
jgi:hypothetical protein